MPRLANPVDLIILILDPCDFRTQFRISLLPRRGLGRVSEARQAMVVCRRRNRQDPADRLDAVDNALIFNEADHRLSGRSSSVPLRGSRRLRR